MSRFRIWSVATVIALSFACSSSELPDEATAARQALTTNGAEVTLTKTSDWNGGYCVDVKITNTGSAAISGWTVIVSLGGSAFGNAWNATTSVSNGTLTAAAVGYNSNIAIGQSASFGFCGNSTTNTQRPTLVSATIQGGSNSSSVGGASATGGVASTGGKSTGGSRATGGSTTGGKSSGGSSATGGSATGGKSSGGSSATGGSATGGKSSGGTSTGGAATGGSTTGTCMAEYTWPTYSPTIAYDYATEYGTLAKPTKDSSDVTGIAGRYTSDWWTFVYGSKKNSLVTSAAWTPMLTRFNTDFAYITDTMRWPRDGRARAGYYSAVYLYGSGLSTDSASNTETGGWQSWANNGPIVLASYYPVYAFDPACTYSDKVAQQGAMIHEGIHSILSTMPGCKNACWFQEGGNTWLQATMTAKRSGTPPTSMGFLSAGAAIAPFMPIESYSGWLQDDSFGGPCAERVNMTNSSGQQVCTWRNLLGGNQYGETFPHAMEVILGEKSVAWVWRYAQKSGRVLQDLAEVTSGLGVEQTKRLIREYRARQAFGDFGIWKTAYKNLLNGNWKLAIGAEWSPSWMTPATWTATCYAATTQSGTTLTPETRTLPGWSGANQIPLTLSTGATCATVNFNPTGANMTCQLVYQDNSGNIHYGSPVSSGACTMPVSNVKNNVVIAVISNQTYTYDGGTTKYGYTLGLTTGISGKADIYTQWYK